ncbi:MAG: hypothetical protein JSU77_10265 [Fidelibacterota bacterium]|nr:MAG: hypothetical protein JSU77_10265 [Candidatus Neomarinimicrobiota bacterium]
MNAFTINPMKVREARINADGNEEAARSSTEVTSLLNTIKWWTRITIAHGRNPIASLNQNDSVFLLCFENLVFVPITRYVTAIPHSHMKNRLTAITG